MVTPTSPTALQLAGLKEMIEFTAEWQDWAGAEYQNRIFYHNNVKAIEGGGFYYPTADLPMIVIWTPSARQIYHSQACFHWSPTLVMLVQGEHPAGMNHNDGAIDFMNHTGNLTQHLSELVGNMTGGLIDTGGGLDIREIAIAAEAQRIPPLKQNKGHDMWTITYAIDAGQRV